MLGLALALAVLIGVSLGLLGSGGSIVTLPVLVYVAGIPAHQAVGMSLAIVGGTSALGSLLNLRLGTLDLRAAAFFSLSGIVGALIGARFTHLVSARSLMMLFGALMLVVGLRMVMGNGEAQSGRKCRPLRCLGTGLGVGLLTGFLGVGGGFVILPALVIFAGLEMKAAIGTSLAVIAVNSFAGLIGQLHYVQFDWPITLGFLGAALAGMVGGNAVASRISSQSLRRAFAGSVIVLGMFLLVRNLWP